MDSETIQLEGTLKSFDMAGESILPSGVHETNILDLGLLQRIGDKICLSKPG